MTPKTQKMLSKVISMKERGKTNSEIAETLKISRPYVSILLKHKKPNVQQKPLLTTTAKLGKVPPKAHVRSANKVMQALAEFIAVTHA